MKVESIPGYTVEDKVESGVMGPVKLEGVLWAPGEHHPSINGVPGKLIVTEENVLDAYPIFKEKVMKGGVLVDVEHVAGKDNLLSDVYDAIALITRVDLEEGKIIAREIKPLKEEFTRLLEKGLVGAFSVSITADVTEENGEHHIQKVYDVERVSIVKNPACPECRVERIDAAGADEDGRRVSLRFGGEILTEQEGVAAVKEASLEEVMAALEEVMAALEELKSKMEEVISAINSIEEPEEPEEGDETPKESVGVESSAADELAREVQEMKEKLELQEAKAIVEAYVEEGKVLPRDIEKHVKIALSNPEEYKELMDDAPVLIDMSRKSVKAEETKEDDRKPTYREFLEEIKKMRGEV